MAAYDAFTASARVLLALYFLVSVVYALLPVERKHHVQVLTGLRVPFPAVSLAIGLALMAVGGVLFVAGWHVEVGVWCLIVMTLASNLMYNRYWNYQDRMQRKFKQMLFFADFAVLGGLLLILRDLS